MPCTLFPANACLPKPVNGINEKVDELIVGCKCDLCLLPVLVVAPNASDTPRSLLEEEVTGTLLFSLTLSLDVSTPNVPDHSCQERRGLSY